MTHAVLHWQDTFLHFPTPFTILISKPDLHLPEGLWNVWQKTIVKETHV